MNFLSSHPWLGVALFLAPLMAVIFLSPWAKQRLPAWLRQDPASYRFEIVLVLVVAVAVYLNSVLLDSSIWPTVWCAKYRVPNVPFGLILGLASLFVTGLGALLSFKVYQEVTSRIDSFSTLLGRVRETIGEIAPDVDAVTNKKPWLYIYAKTPAIGNISADKDEYDKFHKTLLGAIAYGLQVRVVCLPKTDFRSFHEKVVNDPKGVDKDRVDRLTTEAETMLTSLTTNGGIIKTVPHVFNAFLIVTPTRAFQFIIQKVRRDGKHEIDGREIRRSSDVVFMRNSFEQYWDDLP